MWNWFYITIIHPIEILALSKLSSLYFCSSIHTGTHIFIYRQNTHTFWKRCDIRFHLVIWYFNIFWRYKENIFWLQISVDQPQIMHNCKEKSHTKQGSLYWALWLHQIFIKTNITDVKRIKKEKGKRSQAPVL